jgi:hypothetical protein
MKLGWFPVALCVACTATARIRQAPDVAEPPDAGPDATEPVDAALDRRRPVDLPAIVDAGRAQEGPASLAEDAAAPATDVASTADAAPLEDGSAGLVGPDAALWTGQLLVAVGYDGQRMVSQNGKVWTGAMRDGTGNREGPKALRAIAYANRQVVAVGGGCDPSCAGRIVTFDGRDWREVPAGAAKGALTGVAYGNGVWVAVGTTPPILRSTDNGNTWTAAQPAGAPVSLRAVAFGAIGKQPMFVAVGEGYARVTSVDGNTWTNLQPGDGSMDAYRAVAIGNGIVVAAGGSGDGGKTENGRRIRSVDGISWIDEVVDGPEIPNLVFADGNFMAFTGSGDDLLYVSPDGQRWAMFTSLGAGSNVATGKLLRQRLFISRIAPATIKISVDGYVWGPTAAMSMPGDAIINAFVIAGEPAI